MSRSFCGGFHDNRSVGKRPPSIDSYCGFGTNPDSSLIPTNRQGRRRTSKNMVASTLIASVYPFLDGFIEAMDQRSLCSSLQSSSQSCLWTSFSHAQVKHLPNRIPARIVSDMDDIDFLQILDGNFGVDLIHKQCWCTGWTIDKMSLQSHGIPLQTTTNFLPAQWSLSGGRDCR